MKVEEPDQMLTVIAIEYGGFWHTDLAKFLLNLNNAELNTAQKLGPRCEESSEETE